jgi:hypothetical protein
MKWKIIAHAKSEYSESEYTHFSETLSLAWTFITSMLSYNAELNMHPGAIPHYWTFSIVKL